MTNAAVVESRTAGRVRPSYGYYRQPNGWITVSPAADLDELRYQRRGWTFLRSYGRLEMNSPYCADHPLEALFIRGGAKEMPVSQIVEQGLHLNPPIIPTCGTVLNQFHPRHSQACMAGAQPVFFPQMEGRVAEGFPCRFCDESRAAFPTDKARNQHEQVAHKEEKGEVRTGEALASAIIRGLASKDAPKSDEAKDALDVISLIASAGLTKKQREALAAKGIVLPGGDADGD